MREQQIALISMIPGLDTPRELLVIHGLGSQATELAAEFLINPERVADLTAQLVAAQPTGARRTGHFQAILRAEVRDLTPTNGTVVAVRPLP